MADISKTFFQTLGEKFSSVNDGTSFDVAIEGFPLLAKACSMPIDIVDIYQSLPHFFPNVLFSQPFFVSLSHNRDPWDYKTRVKHIK